ncbi:eCIS core domain-containing protein [Hyphobacterium marinum]|uniref:DUF4157 domain-containing protein n=1 Tax=Hyphobacterium marinum TaxID=3116574 RepID=A0ABU7LV17_9PROT|nr:DUF4157 domain-containing protein [Hyphobacterium sp. Y6023]MEE2565407.1 DUF4157 domain-containing protein [Hyphobacterium sp. Y6023]
MKVLIPILAAITVALAGSTGAAAQDDNGGQPVDGDTREQMEQSFGNDASNVRVHTDSAASTAAETSGAQAYTTGNDVVFGGGEYNPGNTDGQRLLGHELTHTVQQQRSVASPAPAEGGTDAEADKDAETRLPERLRHRERNTRNEDDDEERSRRDRPD